MIGWKKISTGFLGAVLCALILSAQAARAQSDPLSSWNDGPAKQAIVDFVHTTTDKASPRFVLPEERIATFDQDGTRFLATRGVGFPTSGRRQSRRC
jgi:hypothetical protein